MRAVVLILAMLPIFPKVAQGMSIATPEQYVCGGTHVFLGYILKATNDYALHLIVRVDRILGKQKSSSRSDRSSRRISIGDIIRFQVHLARFSITQRCLTYIILVLRYPPTAPTKYMTTKLRLCLLAANCSLPPIWFRPQSPGAIIGTLRRSVGSEAFGIAAFHNLRVGRPLITRLGCAAPGRRAPG